MKKIAWVTPALWSLSYANALSEHIETEDHYFVDASSAADELLVRQYDLIAMDLWLARGPRCNNRALQAVYFSSGPEMALTVVQLLREEGSPNRTTPIAALTAFFGKEQKRLEAALSNDPRTTVFGLLDYLPAKLSSRLVELMQR